MNSKYHSLILPNMLDMFYESPQFPNTAFTHFHSISVEQSDLVIEQFEKRGAFGSVF